MKLRKTDIIVIIGSLVVFMSYNIKDVLDFKNLIHEPSGGKVDSFKYSENGHYYIYHTNRGTTLNSKYFFEQNKDPNIQVGDYLIKYPHSLELYVLKVDHNGLLTPEPKIIGSIK